MDTKVMVEARRTRELKNCGQMQDRPYCKIVDANVILGLRCTGDIILS